MICQVCGGGKHNFYCQKDNYSIFKCEACKLLFVDPMPSDEVIAEHYERGYFGGEKFGSYTNYDEDKKAMVKTFAFYLNILHTVHPQARTLLDIGAATGFFVAEASNANFEATGLEISQEACIEARKIGRNVQHGRLGMLDEITTSKSYDVVTMWDVIEHLPNLVVCFSELKRLIPIGGVLLINTPDAGSVWARIFSTKWHSIVPPEHLLWFNKENISQLLQNQGFQVLMKRTTNKSFTLPYIFNMLYRWQKLSIWKYFSEISSRFAGSLSLPIPIGDNMTIIAKRIK